MPNLLTAGLAYDPYFYAGAALEVLYKRLGMAYFVDRSLEAEKAGDKGSTIQLRRPQKFVSQAMPIAEGSIADLTPDYSNLVIDQWQGDAFKLTDKERSLTVERFISEHIEPATVAIADKIDQDLASLALEVPWIVEDTASPNQHEDFPNIRQTLFNNLAPSVNGRDYAYMVDGVLQNRYEKSATFLQANTAGDNAALQRDGVLGSKYGFTIFANQNAPTAVAGTAAATFTVNGVQAKGNTTLVLTVGTPSGTFRRGNVLTIAGDPQLYAIRADVAAAASTTVSISPALAKATAGGEAVTADQAVSTSIGLAFHRRAFALVMQPLEAAGPGIISGTVVDPITGLSVRARIAGSFGTGSTLWGLDALWGFKPLNPNLAVRLRI